MAPAPSRAPENARQSAARAPAPEWPLAPAPAASAMRSDSSSPWLALSGQEQKLVTSYYKSKE